LADLLLELLLAVAVAVFSLGGFSFLGLPSVFHFHIFADWRRKRTELLGTQNECSVCVVPCLFWSRRRLAGKNAIHTRRKRIAERQHTRERDRGRERARESPYVRRRKRKPRRNGTLNTHT